MRYEAEEYVGGAALIPMGAFVSLDTEHRFARSIISVVGRNDVFEDAITRFCAEKNIDIDGVCKTADNTWRSTVLVHDSKTHDGEYPGQRIFLDRGYEEPLSFSQSTIDQLT